jgi:hypothetical protein
MIETKVTYTLEQDGHFYLVENVPARISPETGEQFFSPETVQRLQSFILQNKKPIKVVQTPVFEFAVWNLISTLETCEAFTRENVRSIRPGNGMLVNELSRVLGRRAEVLIERGNPLAVSNISGGLSINKYDISPWIYVYVRDEGR